MSSQFNADVPVSSAPILVLSPPDTQDGPQDVFHTPSEESSLHSSVEVDVLHCTLNHAVDLESGTQGFSDCPEFLDLGKDTELGFLENQLKNGIGSESVEGDEPSEIPETHSGEIRVLEREIYDLGESPVKKLKLGLSSSGVQESCGVEGGELGEIPEIHYNEIRVLEREISDLGESPVKKLKLGLSSSGVQQSCGVEGGELGEIPEIHYNEIRVLEREISDLGESPVKKLKLGLGSSGAQSLNVEDGMGNSEEEKVESPGVSGEVVGGEQMNVDAVNDDEFCREIEMDENSVLEENVEAQVVQNDVDVNLNEGNKSSDEVVEGSRTCEEPVQRVLPNSIQSRLENTAANEVESGRNVGERREEVSVFDVLRVLAERERETAAASDDDDDDNDDDDDGLTVLEVANRAGLTFTRPSWLTDDMNFDFVNFTD